MNEESGISVTVKKMRILVVNYEFPPVGGGGGNAAADLCRMFAKKGHQVYVHTAAIHGLSRIEERDGYRIRRFPSMRKKKDHCSVMEMVWFVVLNIVPVIHTVLALKPDIVHVHFAIPTGILGLIQNFITRRPYVLTAHLGDVPGGVPEQTNRFFKLLKPLTVPIWRNAAAITAVSSYVRDLAVRSYPGIEVHVINNGIELKEQVSKPLPDGAHVRLVFAGRISIQKNPIFLVRLLRRIADLEWHMDIIGDGPLMDEMRREIKINGLECCITLHGWRDQDYVDKKISESDVLLAPSLSEGFSIVSAKALSYGLAIIASRTGGNTDIVEDGVNGYLCEVNDASVFEDRLRRVLTSNRLLNSMKSASRARAQLFDINLSAEAYEKLFLEVLRKNAKKNACFLQ